VRVYPIEMESPKIRTRLGSDASADEGALAHPQSNEAATSAARTALSNGTSFVLRWTGAFSGR